MYNTVCPSKLCEMGEINKKIIRYSLPTRVLTYYVRLKLLELGGADNHNQQGW